MPSKKQAGRIRKALEGSAATFLMYQYDHFNDPRHQEWFKAVEIRASTRGAILDFHSATLPLDLLHCVLQALEFNKIIKLRHSHAKCPYICWDAEEGSLQIIIPELTIARDSREEKR